jgi:hypothetical protein
VADGEEDSWLCMYRNTFCALWPHIYHSHESKNDKSDRRRANQSAGSACAAIHCRRRKQDWPCAVAYGGDGNTRDIHLSMGMRVGWPESVHNVDKMA